MTFDKTVPLLRQIGRYQILREVGRGTMGIVYEAFDPKLERTVALKTVRFEPGDPEHREYEERFQREAKSAARLNHPNIVTIHDAGEEDGVAYIAMEFLEGKSLRELLDSGTSLTVTERIDYTIQMAEALDYAHRFDIVHRDIKPGNVVISSQGRVKISDFGIAQLPSGNLTQAGTILGTPKYMSPEQVRGERLDGRSDIFSLGVILYEIFAGKAPFVGDSLAAIMYQILHGLPPDPILDHPDCPAGVRQIMGRCLAKDKHERYPQAGDIVADLRRYSKIQPEPTLIASIFSSNEPAKSVATVSANISDQTQPLNPVAGPMLEVFSTPARSYKLQWLSGLGAVGILLIAVAIWKFNPDASANAQATNTEARQTAPTQTAPDPTQEKSKTNEPASGERKVHSASSAKKGPAEATKASSTDSKPKKGFWRRQVDCFKHGNCEKPAQPDTPPPFSP